LIQFHKNVFVIGFGNWNFFIVNMDEISIDEFNELRMKDRLTIIDIREMHEQPTINEFPVIQIPLTKWEEIVHKISTEQKIIVICQLGIRSLNAVNKLKEIYSDKYIYRLQGGIIAWITNNKLTRI